MSWRAHLDIEDEQSCENDLAQEKEEDEELPPWFEPRCMQIVSALTVFSSFRFLDQVHYSFCIHGLKKANSNMNTDSWSGFIVCKSCAC